MRSVGDDALVVGDYNAERGRTFARSLSDQAGFAVADVHDRSSIEEATDEVDAVIVAVRQVKPHVQAVCTDRGIPSVDIVPDTPLARSIFSPTTAEAADGRMSSSRRLSGMVAAGLIPGLSGLMARQVIEEARRGETADLEVHVSLLQRKNGTAGAAGIADMLGLFSRPVEYQGHRVRGFTRRRNARFPEPFDSSPVRLVAFPEASDVKAHFGINRVYYWTAFDDGGFNKTIGALNRLGVLSRFREPGGGIGLAGLLARNKVVPAGSEETVALTAEAGGMAISLTVPSDYGGTAMAAVAMTRALVARDDQDYGVVLPFQLFTLPQIVAQIASPEIVVTTESGLS